MNKAEKKKFKKLLKIYYDSAEEGSESDGINELLEIKEEVEFLVDK